MFFKVIFKVQRTILLKQITKKIALDHCYLIN